MYKSFFRNWSQQLRNTKKIKKKSSTGFLLINSKFTIEKIQISVTEKKFHLDIFQNYIF